MLSLFLKMFDIFCNLWDLMTSWQILPNFALWFTNYFSYIWHCFNCISRSVLLSHLKLHPQYPLLTPHYPMPPRAFDFPQHPIFWKLTHLNQRSQLSLATLPLKYKNLFLPTLKGGLLSLGPGGVTILSIRYLLQLPFNATKSLCFCDAGWLLVAEELQRIPAQPTTHWSRFTIFI